MLDGIFANFASEILIQIHLKNEENYLNFLLGLLLFPAVSLQADTTSITILIKKKGGGGTGSIGHGPVMGLPVDIVLNDITGELTVAAPENVNGCVYVYSVDGIQEAYSPELNATFTLPQTDDIHIISLQGNNWFGEGKVVY